MDDKIPRGWLMKPILSILLSLGAIASGCASCTSSDGAADSGVPDAGTDAGPGDGGSDAGYSSYDQLVLADQPVAFWKLAATGATEPDITGNGNTGTYRGGMPAAVALPNGDVAADFNGTSEYLTVPSNASFSISTTGSLSWEAWIRPDTLLFPNGSADGYVAWMGKCATYSPTCEWEARIYDSSANTSSRCTRLSVYVFNPTAALGSGAFWQPTCGLFQAGHWYHVVGEYTTLAQPASCPDSATYPGSINVWVNGIPWDQSSHGSTGCMSQYQVIPKANGSALNIGSMALDSWFQGAIGKVAVYNHLLSQSQITAHYRKMTGQDPSGSCADTCTLTNP